MRISTKKKGIVERLYRFNMPSLSADNNLDPFEIYANLKLRASSKLLILMYHRIGTHKDFWSIPPIDPLIFEKQIEYIKNMYEILSLDELVELILKKEPLPRRVAVLTFDDGYKDVYEYAYPLLKKYRIPATIFLTTGFIGRDDLFWWDKVGYTIWNTEKRSLELSDLCKISLASKKEKLFAIKSLTGELKQKPNNKKIEIINALSEILNVEIPLGLGRKTILSWDEIIQMSQNGIEFGAHTVSHPILTKINLDEAEFEIMKSRYDIQDRIKKNVITFSYPNGQEDDYNPRIINLLRNNGFKCALTSFPKELTQKNGFCELGRTPAYCGSNLNLFKLYNTGLLSNIAKLM